MDFLPVESLAFTFSGVSSLLTTARSPARHASKSDRRDSSPGVVETPTATPPAPPVTLALEDEPSHAPPTTSDRREDILRAERSAYVYFVQLREHFTAGRTTRGRALYSTRSLIDLIVECFRVHISSRRFISSFSLIHSIRRCIASLR